MPRRLSADTIRTRINQLEKQARALERTATKGLRAAAALIDKYSLSLADLRQAFDMSKGRGKRGSLAGRTIPVKYRDHQGNTWTGRGRPPLWLVAAEKAGKKRESFLVGVQKAKTRKPKRTPKAARSKNGAASAPSGPADSSA